MLRYLVNLVLFATALIAGYQIVNRIGSDAAGERAQRSATAESLHVDVAPETRKADIVSVAEAWQRYTEAARRGIVCADDVPPHPGVVAAVLVILALRVLSLPLRARAAV